MIRERRPYEAFADVYDAIGLGTLSKRSALLASTLLPVAGRLLDLGCGTGVAACDRAAAGWQVCGLDLSADMLGIAQSRARDAGLPVRFVEGDMRCMAALVGDAHFDLVTCFGDTLAEFREDEALDVVFRQVREVTEAGALFVFELRRAALLAQWDARDEVLHDDGGILAYVQRDFRARLGEATSRYVWFVKDIERWWRDECTIVTRLWPDDMIEGALSRAGFMLEARLTHDGRPAGGDDEWVLFVARVAP